MDSLTERFFGEGVQVEFKPFLEELVSSAKVGGSNSPIWTSPT